MQQTATPLIAAANGRPDEVLLPAPPAGGHAPSWRSPGPPHNRVLAAAALPGMLLIDSDDEERHTPGRWDYRAAIWNARFGGGRMPQSRSAPR